jgi:hypothetical protein
MIETSKLSYRDRKSLEQFKEQLGVLKMFKDKKQRALIMLEMDRQARDHSEEPMADDAFDNRVS